MTLQLKYPTYYSMINDQVIKHAESSAEIMYSTVMLCLDTLHVKDELMKFADEPVEDIVEFIGSLTPDQFSKLSEFANSVPEVTHNANFVCTKCNQKNEQLLEGTNSFFL